jgi:hypothetical protein
VYVLGMTPPYSVVTGVQLGVWVVTVCVQFGVCVVSTSVHMQELLMQI